MRRIERMVDADRWCIDTLNQVGAATTALVSIGLEILSDHVTHCVKDSLAPGDERTASAKSNELLAAVQRFAKTS